MVKFALTDFDFDDCARLDAGLRGLAAWTLPAGLAGLAADLFLSVRAGLGVSRPAGFCAKAPREKMRIEKTEETKRIEGRGSKIE
jgi:hypothetical protein